MAIGEQAVKCFVRYLLTSTHGRGVGVGSKREENSQEIGLKECLELRRWKFLQHSSSGGGGGGGATDRLESRIRKVIYSTPRYPVILVLIFSIDI